MRVLMVEPGGIGGMYAYADGLSRGLTQVGLDVTVLTCSLWPEGPAPYAVAPGLLPVLEPKRTWSRLHWAADRLRRTLTNSLRRNSFGARSPFDVVHMQGGVPLVDQVLLRPLAWRRAVVLTVHDVQQHSERVISRPGFLSRYFRIPRRLIVHFADGKRQMIEDWGIPPDRVDVIPHGLPAVKRCDRAVARAQLDLAQDASIILFFGAIRDNKGLDVLIRAMAEIRRREPGALLVIAGRPRRDVSFQRYAHIIRECGVGECVRLYVRFIPEDEVDVFFSAADVVALPYLRFEAQSGVLLRAYAHGLPVVATRVGAITELVEADKVGIVVPPGDVEALGSGVVEALHRTSAFTKRYAAGVAARYAWENVARLHERTYRLAIAGE